MARKRVLLTGFGPFPGAPENPSARLVETLADRAPELDYELHARVLPTEWEQVAALAPDLYASLQPHVMIHFGLSLRAKGFRLERLAYNRAAPHADAYGALPRGRAILPGAPGRIETAVPARKAAAHLRAQGLAASTSQSAGRYLCNFLYYRSLEWSARQETPSLALFVHIPPASVQGGPFSEAELLTGAHETLRFVLAFADSQDRSPLPRLPIAHDLQAENKSW